MKKKVVYNSISPVVNQITTLVCGFILPRLILAQYGSATNGLLNSITGFFAFASFMDFGVGAVAQSSLYKPLAENDYDTINAIIASATNYFKKISIIILVYTGFLVAFYSAFSYKEYDFVFLSTLILSISLSFFVQYYIGSVDRILLFSDQKGYITFFSHSISVIISTVIGVLIISNNGSIQFVKLSASLVYLLRIAVVRMYVDRIYRINRRLKNYEEPLHQKWNGFAQHLSSIVLDNTDTIVLTIFSTLSNVSIYAVYYLVINAIRQFIYSLTVGMQALLGELYAKEEKDELVSVFKLLEWSTHNVGIFLFGCTSVLVVGFIDIYTSNVNDANYHLPVFALCIAFTGIVYSIRLPYNHLLLASGHFKQTQHYYIIAVVLNLTLSIASVKRFGLIGVTVGTIVALIYHIVCLIWYDSKQIVDWGVMSSVRLMFMDACELIIGGVLMHKLIVYEYRNVFEWVVIAFVTAAIWIVILAAFNLIFAGKEMLGCIMQLRKRR